MYAQENLEVELDGKQYRFEAGEFVDDNHPVVREWSRSFHSESPSKREQRLREAAKHPGTQVAGADFGGRDSAGSHPDDRVSHPRLSETREGALRTVERHVKAGALSSTAADRVDTVLRGPDNGFGLDAAYIEAAGSEAYERGFAKLIRYGDGAILRMTPEEQEAVQRTNRAEEFRTALTSGSGAGGGFAIPIAIDPTINLSSNGVLNPIRELAEVRTMATRELRLVTSEGVVAQYQAEAAEAVDNAPVLAQPTLVANRATSTCASRCSSTPAPSATAGSTRACSSPRGTSWAPTSWSTGSTGSPDRRRSRR
jgi:hypothetical protein